MPKQRPTNLPSMIFQSPSLNAAIIFLAFVVIAFVVSFVQNNWHDEAKVALIEPNLSQPAKLFEEYDRSPLAAVQVEVLNGCGVQGLGGRFTDFLRSYRVDVIATENADHFDYSHTQVIQRSQYLDRGYEIASLLGIDRESIVTDVNLDLDVDVTVIIGRDYLTIGSYEKYLESRRLN
ncbi:MAG: LytR C-terminal domain-containing protein [Fidelibacterota bacterium]